MVQKAQCKSMFMICTIQSTTASEFTRKRVLGQRVQPAYGTGHLPLSVRGPSREASQCVLRLGGALVPLGQLRVRLQRG